MIYAYASQSCERFPEGFWKFDVWKDKSEVCYAGFEVDQAPGYRSHRARCPLRRCSGAGTRRSAVPANILEPERRAPVNIAYHRRNADSAAFPSGKSAQAAALSSVYYDVGLPKCLSIQQSRIKNVDFYLFRSNSLFSHWLIYWRGYTFLVTDQLICTRNLLLVTK